MVAGYQGVISNESEISLRDAVILGPGLAYRLERDFAPGDILTLSSEELRADISDAPAQPNPLELHVAAVIARSPFSGSGRNRSIRDIQGERYLRTRAFLRAESPSERQMAREQSFLASFMVDQFNSDARGSGLYLVGWNDEWERDLEIIGAGWSSIDSTLYVIELDVDIKLPTETATLTSEFFSWMTIDRKGLIDNGTDNFSLYEEQSVEYLFHPLPGLSMNEVGRLFVEVDRGGGYAQSLDVELYNWVSDEYDTFGYRVGDELGVCQSAGVSGPGQCPANAPAIRRRVWHGAGAQDPY